MLNKQYLPFTFVILIGAKSCVNTRVMLLTFIKKGNFKAKTSRIVIYNSFLDT